MTDSYTAELHDLIDRVFTADLGGRATAQMVHVGVHEHLPPHLVDYLIGKGLRSEIRAYFREQDTEGLPKRPEVNQHNEHVQIAFLSIEEFSYVHGRYVDRAQANAAQAEKVRTRCLDVHGVDLAAIEAVVA